MKKIFSSLVLITLLASCYKDDYINDFDYSAVYFPYQTDVRTLVVGEGMQIQMGAALGGVRENTKDRNVFFTLDNSLITSSILTTMKNGDSYIKAAVQSVSQLNPLPGDYFTLSNNKNIVIKKGEHSGTVTLSVDSIKFLSDPATLNANYVLPFYIQTADADSILSDKRYAVIGIKYENMLFGNYWHGGITIRKDAAGNTIDTVKYYTTIPSPESKVWKLTTIAPNQLVTNGFSDQMSTKAELKLTLNGNNIAVSSGTGSTFTYAASGSASAFNGERSLQSRFIFLRYSYTDAAGRTCLAQDTLTFRNRIRDGVNEWQN
jgi:hypothetical protein